MTLELLLSHIGTRPKRLFNCRIEIYANSSHSDTIELVSRGCMSTESWSIYHESIVSGPGRGDNEDAQLRVQRCDLGHPGF